MGSTTNPDEEFCERFYADVSDVNSISVAYTEAAERADFIRRHNNARIAAEHAELDGYRKRARELVAKIAEQRAHHLPVFTRPPTFKVEADLDLRFAERLAKLVYEKDVSLLSGKVWNYVSESSVKAEEIGSSSAQRIAARARRPTAEEVAAATATLAAHYRLDPEETRLGLLYVAASKKATERALNATPEEADQLKGMKRLRSLALDLYQRRSVAELLPRALKNQQQCDFASQLAGTSRELRKLEDQLRVEPRTPKDGLVTKADARRKAFQRQNSLKKPTYDPILRSVAKAF
jgi:hypothetical protein